MRSSHLAGNPAPATPFDIFAAAAMSVNPTDTIDKLTRALDLARRGFAVFPLVANTKLPRKDSRGCYDATTDEAQIRRWWAETPDANIAIATENHLVLDEDPRHGGEITLAGHILAGIDLPETLWARTQSGGRHFIYALPPEVKVSGGESKLGKGLDVKSRGGYIVAVGSDIDGRPYTWGNDAPVALAPQSLIDLCGQCRARTKAAGKRIVEEDETAIKLATDWLHDHAPTAHEGARDKTAYKVAARFYDFAASHDTVLALLAEWNDTKAFPALEMRDIERIARSAETSRENAVGARHPSASGFDAVEIAERTGNGIDPVDLWDGSAAPAALPQGVVPELVEQVAHDKAKKLGVEAGAPVAALLTALETA
jgi:hypothetical protein